MTSDKPMGYPPRKHFMRTALEDAWKTAVGALDLGDFDTFLRESADLSYEEALKKVYAKGEKKESVPIQEGKLAEETSDIVQYQNIAEELRQSGDDYRASAIESLIAELIAERNKPKRAARQPKKKAEPALISKPPTKLEQFEQQGTHGEDFDWLHKFIISDGLDDLAEASRLVELPDTKLSTEERGYLSGLIEQKRQEALAVHPKGEKEVFKKIEKQPTSQPKKIPEPGKVRTSKDIRESRTEKEKIESFQPVQIEFRVLNPSNAERFLQQYKKYLPEIIRNGIKAWFDQHPEVYTFPLTSPNLFNLGRAFGNLIERKRPEITKLRDRLAIEYITADPVYFIEYGFNQAVQLNPAFNFEAKYSYYKGLKTPNLPENSSEFKKEIVESARKLIFNA